MLHLAEETAHDWFERVADDLDTILIDHAHLEKRAASTALSMIFRYTSKRRLVRELSEVVREEMEHFERLLDVMVARDIEFDRLDPAPYASHLVKHARKQDPDALLDRLLIAALIEARSCERFRILAANIDDLLLRELYADLVEAEARHHTLYTGLAREYFDVDVVESRLEELARVEVEAIEASAGAPRLHSA